VSIFYLNQLNQIYALVIVGKMQSSCHILLTALEIYDIVKFCTLKTVKLWLNHQNEIGVFLFLCIAQYSQIHFILLRKTFEKTIIVAKTLTIIKVSPTLT